MRSLTYFSTASRHLTAEELETLHQQCRESNARNAITGMMLYKHGNFLQVIEGPTQAIGDLYSRLQVDPRHKELALVSDKFIEYREFPNWTMGFKNLEQMAGNIEPGLENGANPFNSHEFLNHKDRTHDLLLFFAKNG
jgi:hypothetical protein